MRGIAFVETKKEGMKREQQLKTSAGRRLVREQVGLVGHILSRKVIM
jgi:hypothetical protein